MSRQSSGLLRGWAAAALVSLAGICDSTSASERFELRIPGERAEVFVGNEILLTRETVEQLKIEIPNPIAEEIATDKIYPKINGESAATISELRGTSRGKFVVLNLEMKPHLGLVPGINTVEIVAENHRGRRFYQNWIVRLRDRSRHEWFTFEHIDGPGESNPAPPEIEVLSPSVPPLAERGATGVEVSIRARVAAYHPLDLVSVNGSAVPIAAGEDELEIERSVTMGRSSDGIVLRVRDERGNETRVWIPIHKEAAASPPKLSGKRYLLAVGLTDYQSNPAGFPRLPGASTAAGDLARVLVEKAGFAEDAVLVLRDREATLARVGAALRDFVSRPGPDDLLILYLGAYGLHGLGSESDESYLACWDSRLDQLQETALSLDRLASLLEDTQSLRSRNVVLLFEPRSMPNLDRDLAGSNLVNARLLQLFSADRGRTVLVSADVNQDSRPTSDDLHGVFAQALLKGLEGEADWNRDRILTVNELFDFVSTNVRAESDGAQVPRYRIADEVGALLSLEHP